MSSRALLPSTYLLVLVALVILTFLTIGISFAPLAGKWHIVLGLIVATIKASLVVLFFMHALVSPRLTWVVIAAAVFWMVVILGALTLQDYLTRGLIPFMPGH